MSGGGFDELKNDEKFVLMFEIYGKKNLAESKEFCDALDVLLRKHGAKTKAAVRGSKQPGDP
jgi:hypothetical protein